MAAVNMDFSLANQLAELEQLNQKLDQFRSIAGFDSKCFREICLALEELFSNIVRHGHKDGCHHNVSFNLSLKDDTLTISITDDGVPFDPNAAPAPDLKCELEKRQVGGLGVYLVKKVMDEVRYVRCDNQNMTILTKSVGGPPCMKKGAAGKV